uniref:Putative reeler n=1 Tax=Lutzomyia longipalpis TaxID=7200 RepID=A0A1B0CAY5_LUTLO
MFKLLLILGLCFVQIFAEASHPRFSCDFDSVHGVPSQPADTLPYNLQVSGYDYNPGTTITVTIDGDTFRGFYIRAFDEASREPSGTWKESTSLHAMDRCNAAIQADREDKESVELKWNSPPEGSGKVYFKALVMKDYSTYWSDLILKEN